jgi:uncharacterized protein YbjT (DUF2867 family)
MICVTGASGTVGREVVKQLQALNAPFRAAVSSAASAHALRARGVDTGGDVVICDYRQPETVRAALHGCDTLFLLGPNVIDQTPLETGVVDAAKASGIRHIVKLSVMGAPDEAYSLAHVHRPVEKAIESSGLGWTCLRPNSYMQNVVTFMKPTIQSDSVFYSASGDARISHVDARDIAAVAAHALTAPDQHHGRAYLLTGPEAITYDDLASAVSSVLERQIAHVSLPPEDLKAGMLAEGVPEPLADRLLDLERYFREGRASIISPDIERITGRPPIPLAQYLRDHASLLKA